MIPQRNISILSNRLARAGGRRVPEAVLERDYCLAWFLIGLSGTPLREHLVFKGGTALKRCYFGDYRFSEDLDFSLANEMPLDAILAGLEDVYGVEKIVALTDRARNEPRDLYDLWYLTSEKHIDLAMLIPEIYSKLEFRGRDSGTIGADFENKEVRYRKLWNTRLNTQMAFLPPFDGIFRSVRRTIRSAGLFGGDEPGG